METTKLCVDVIGVANQLDERFAVCLCYEWQPKQAFLVPVKRLPEDVQGLLSYEKVQSRTFPLHDEPLTLVCDVNTKAGSSDELLESFKCDGEAEEED